MEHGIQPDGQMPSDKTIGGGDDAFNTLPGVSAKVSGGKGEFRTGEKGKLLTSLGRFGFRALDIRFGQFPGRYQPPKRKASRF